MKKLAISLCLDGANLMASEHAKLWFLKAGTKKKNMGFYRFFSAGKEPNFIGFLKKNALKLVSKNQYIDPKKPKIH